MSDDVTIDSTEVVSNFEDVLKRNNIAQDLFTLKIRNILEDFDKMPFEIIILMLVTVIEWFINQKKDDEFTVYFLNNISANIERILKEKNLSTIEH